MGTHPIFESDFDCLTDVKWENQYRDWVQFYVAIIEL